MMTNTQVAVQTLNKLIEVCLDGELGYRTAAEHIHDSKLRFILTDYAIRRSQFADELREEVQRLGGSPSDSGTVAASLHRGWIALKSAASHGDPSAIVAACETGEDSARATYEMAVNSEISGATRTLIEEQWRAIDSARERMRQIHMEAGAPAHRV